MNRSIGLQALSSRWAASRPRRYNPAARGMRSIPNQEPSMKKEEVLAKLAAGEPSVDEASKMLADNEPKRGTLYCKVSEKGAISVYGLQRMPVTLYVEQWQRLLDYGDEIRKFMTENDAKLKRKER